MRRPERVAESLREEVVQIVGYELDDPRVLGVTVTDVRMAENLRDAKIYVTVAGTEDETRLALEALNHAAPYVRRQLSLALELRHAPVLHFVRDKTEERATRIDSLLTEVKLQEKNASTDATASRASADALTETEGDSPPPRS